MILLGMLLISFFANILYYFDLLFPFSEDFAYSYSILVTTLMILFVGFGYYNAFASNYSKSAISIRIFLFYALIFIEIGLLFLIAFGFASDWKYGRIVISPFN
jgi:type IV secretory pathway TrbL component